MGFRLPLDSLPWEDPATRQFLDERDPFAPRGRCRRHVGPAVPAELARPRPTLLDV